MSTEPEVFQLTEREAAIYRFAFKEGWMQRTDQLRGVEMLHWMFWSNPVREAYYHTLRRFITPEFMEWNKPKDEA
jgi:hypothetical protein